MYHPCTDRSNKGVLFILRAGIRPRVQFGEKLTDPLKMRRVFPVRQELKLHH
jgi:hypothetical protein